MVVYWHEKARARSPRQDGRVGLLATQGIRGGANRRVLERIKGTGDIFLAWWTSVGPRRRHRPRLVPGLRRRLRKTRTLDGLPVACHQREPHGRHRPHARGAAPREPRVAFMGDTKGGPFDIDAAEAARCSRPEPRRAANADVVGPWVNGLDITRRPRECGSSTSGSRCRRQKRRCTRGPSSTPRWFQPVRRRTASATKTWWQHERPRPELRAAISGLTRYIATPNVTKHRLFVWLDPETVPDHQLIAFARDDDFTFGVLHSRVHELWARGLGTQLREVESGFRYTPTTCFETFPVPVATSSQREAIEDASRRLVMLRNGWLNPTDADAAALAGRTLTNLYNERPTWLTMAHEALDAAVLDAYGLPADGGDDQVLAHLLDLNLSRASASAGSRDAAAAR